MRKPLMHRDVPETTEFEAFLAIVDHGSFAAAASALGLPRATVSRRLKRLEERLATRLFRRTTRKVALTRAGADLDPHARRILAAVHAATAAVEERAGPPRGLLRVSVPPRPFESLDRVLLSFMVAFPQVQLEVERSSRQVDVVAGGFDVAVRASPSLDPGLIARKLVTVKLRLWASVAYLSARGTPEGVGELGSHACLVGYERGERPASHWPLLAGGRVAVAPRLACNDILMLAQVAMEGHGIALLPEPVAIAHGLRQVLPDIVGAESSLTLVYADRHTGTAVRAFVDHVLAHRETLFLPGPATGVP